VSADPHTYPGLCFLCDDEAKTMMYRLHMDLAPDGFEAEVRRIIGSRASAATSASASPLTSPWSSSPIRRATSSVC
jgi:hypothetical protein